MSSINKKTNAAVEASIPMTSNDASSVVTFELEAEEIVGATLGAAVAPTPGGRGIATAGGGGGITALGGGGGMTAPAGLFSLSFGAELASPSEEGGGGGGGGVSRLIFVSRYQVLERW
jgi:hypothetical protein